MLTKQSVPSSILKIKGERGKVVNQKEMHDVRLQEEAPSLEVEAKAAVKVDVKVGVLRETGLKAVVGSQGASLLARKRNLPGDDLE